MDFLNIKSFIRVVILLRNENFTNLENSIFDHNICLTKLGFIYCNFLFKNFVFIGLLENKIIHWCGYFAEKWKFHELGEFDFQSQHLSDQTWFYLLNFKIASGKWSCDCVEKFCIDKRIEEVPMQYSNSTMEINSFFFAYAELVYFIDFEIQIVQKACVSKCQ